MSTPPPFDSEAAAYDAVFTESFIGKRARARFWRTADACLIPGMRVLELGGGTGEDACHFAGRGLQVVCTDVSSGMLHVAALKASTRGLVGRIDFLSLDMLQLAAGECPDILTTAGPFDAAYSNFGGLNCVEDLSGLGRALGGLLKPGAPLLLSVMGRHCPWEWVWYAAQGRPRKGFRRLKRDGTLWRGLRIRYPSPGQLAQALSPTFELHTTSVVNACLPPSYTEAALRRYPRLLRALDAADTRWEHSSVLAGFSDHYLAHFVRRA